MRSVHEIRDYLTKKQFDSDTVDRVVNQLLKDKFLNDLEFSRMWIESRQRRGKSIFVIRLELVREKKVAESIVDEAFQLHARPDEDVASELVEKYKNRYKGEKYTQKMGAFLQRRGFSWGIVRKVIFDKD